MSNKIKIGRATKARIEAIKGTLDNYEIVYSMDTNELGVKNADGTITYFGVVSELEWSNILNKPDFSLKLDKNFSTLPAQTNPLLTDVLVLNRGTTVQRITLGNLLSQVDNEIVEVVSVLPTTGVANKIYLVPSIAPETQNSLDKFIWVSNAWEKIGVVSLDVVLNRQYQELKRDFNSFKQEVEEVFTTDYTDTVSGTNNIELPSVVAKAPIRLGFGYEKGINNLAIPDLTGKAHLGNGTYRLYNVSGITLDYNISNGVYALNGTINASGSVKILMGDVSGWQQGQTYTGSLNGLNSSYSGNDKFESFQINTGGNYSPYWVQNINTTVNGGTITTTLSNQTIASFYLTIRKGSSHSAITFNDWQFTLQIEEGSQATDYQVPYIEGYTKTPQTNLRFTIDNTSMYIRGDRELVGGEEVIYSGGRYFTKLNSNYSPIESSGMAISKPNERVLVENAMQEVMLYNNGLEVSGNYKIDELEVLTIINHDGTEVDLNINDATITDTDIPVGVNRNLTWDISGKMDSTSEYVNVYTSSAQDFTTDYNTHDGHFLLNGVIYEGTKNYSRINIEEQGIYTVSVSKIGGHSSGNSFYLRSDVNGTLLEIPVGATKVVERVTLGAGYHKLSITTYAQVDFENCKLEIQIERYDIETPFQKPTEEASYDELPFENQGEYDKWILKHKDTKITHPNIPNGDLVYFTYKYQGNFPDVEYEILYYIDDKLVDGVMFEKLNDLEHNRNDLTFDGLPILNGKSLTDIFDVSRNLTWDISGKMDSTSEYVNVYTSSAQDFTTDYNTHDGHFLLNGVIYEGSKNYSRINIKEQGIYTVSVSKIGGNFSGGSFNLRSSVIGSFLTFSEGDTKVVERVELNAGVHVLGITTYAQVDFENLKLEIQIERYGIKTSFKKPTEDASYDELPFENQEEYDKWLLKYKDIKDKGSTQVLLEGSNQTEIATINERISLIEDSVTLPTELKPHYIEAIEDKELDALSNVTKDTLDFVILTDTQHDNFESDSNGQIGVFEQIERFTNNNKVDFAIHLGDWISSGGLKEDTVEKLEVWSDYFNKINVNKLLTIGNHDDGAYGNVLEELDYSNILNKDDLYKVLFRPNLMEGCRFNNKDTNGLYYYKDFEGHNVRVIVLDSIDFPEVYNSNGYLKYRGQNAWGFAKKQIEWLAHEALNLKRSKVNYQDWQVIIMTHLSIGDKVNYYGIDGWRNKNWEIVYDIVNAFINGSAYVGESADYVEEPVSINVDFSDQGIIPFIGWFAGHSHIDITGKDPDHDFTTRTSVCATANNRRSTTGSAGVGVYYTYDRPANSKQTTAFDAVSINLRERKVKITRIGAGNDAEFSY